jgi:hypothetical protein
MWNYLIHEYHYKGFRILVGAHIKVMAYAGGIPLACLSWSSSVGGVSHVLGGLRRMEPLSHS